jgi:hypothetical protein
MKDEPSRRVTKLALRVMSAFIRIFKAAAFSDISVPF